MIELTVNQCVTDGRMVDALRLSTLQDPAPLIFGILAQSLQRGSRSRRSSVALRNLGPVAERMIKAAMCNPRPDQAQLARAA